MDDWRETKRSDDAWSTFLCGAINRIVYVEVRKHYAKLEDIPYLARNRMRLIDFDDDSVVCVSEDGQTSILFSRSDIVSIICSESFGRGSADPVREGEGSGKDPTGGQEHVMDKKLGIMLRVAVKAAGSYDPATCLPLIEEDLTEDEYRRATEFLRWVYLAGKTFGRGNLDAVYQKFLEIVEWKK